MTDPQKNTHGTLQAIDCFFTGYMTMCALLYLSIQLPDKFLPGSHPHPRNLGYPLKHKLPSLK